MESQDHFGYGLAKVVSILNTVGVRTTLSTRVLAKNMDAVVL
jgi:hypothetical protein